VKDSETKTVTFDEAFLRVGLTGMKLQTADYRAEGMYPVVDQGQALISAFTDNAALLQSPPSDGFVVFGDHTRIVKHIDFPFVVGADGVQLLRSRQGFDARYLALCLRLADIPNTGYNRHFKFLKDLHFRCPLLAEQQAIAEALSDADALVEALDALIAKKRDMKQAAMESLLARHGVGNLVSIDDVTERSAGFWGKSVRASGDEQYGVIRAGDISSDGKLMDAAQRFLSPVEVERSEVREGDVVITASGNGLGKTW